MVDPVQESQGGLWADDEARCFFLLALDAAQIYLEPPGPLGVVGPIQTQCLDPAFGVILEVPRGPPTTPAASLRVQFSGPEAGDELDKSNDPPAPGFLGRLYLPASAPAPSKPRTPSLPCAPLLQWDAPRHQGIRAARPRRAIRARAASGKQVLLWALDPSRPCHLPPAGLLGKSSCHLSLEPSSGIF